MARKQKHEEHENHERWLVSYADFITLLFAFFVVMYSVSSVNEGKYRVLSSSLTAAFRQAPHSIAPVQVGDQSGAQAQGELPIPGSNSLIALPVPAPPPVPVSAKTEAARKDTTKKDAAEKDKEKPAEKTKERPKPGGDKLKPLDVPTFVDPKMGEIADKITTALGGMIKDDLIKVRRSERWLEVEIKSSILFPSGSARLTPNSYPMLEELAKILAPFPNPIHVEGFTDNVPIHSIAFLSNWELSAARAASVVHLFMQTGVSPERMAAIGYGEFKAVGDNATPEGRAKNRRVILVVMPGDDPRWADATMGAQASKPPKAVAAPANAAPPKSEPAKPVASKSGPAAAVQPKSTPVNSAPADFIAPAPKPASVPPTKDDPFINPNAPPPVNLGVGGARR